MEEIYQAEMGMPSRAPFIGFVHLDPDPVPLQGKAYPVIPAGAAPMSALPYPVSPSVFLDLDLHAFYSGDLPDAGWNGNEGMLKLQVDTRAPQDLSAEATASFVTQFKVGDYAYAPTFATRGVFRNVLFTEFVNLRISLFELDSDLSEGFDRIKKVIDESGLSKIDVLKGIPYLDVGTKLIESLVRNFGKNPDDDLWGELPIFQLRPLIGSAFLRNGIYVTVDQPDEGARLDWAKVTYSDNTLRLGRKQLEETHLIWSMGLRPADIPA